MTEFTFHEMQAMQKKLQEKYKEKWGGLSPDKAVEKLLWLHGELGEVSDIIKKNGSEMISAAGPVRQHFIEEMCDVLMYFNDVLICYDISPEEIATAYRSKFNSNMQRW